MKKILGDLSADEFLRDYWQKQPLLIKNAIPNYQSPIGPEELMEYAWEPEVESRLILEKDGSHPWECRYGPFDDEDFAHLPKSHWTLLIQECNRYHHDLAMLLERFNFIPNWRVDDVMASYAPLHGSVGPHVDQYDVFLLQGLGQRRWQISNQSVNEDDIIPDLDLKILNHFSADEEWILQPGDILYLPPGIPHHGVALEDCITLSIGFRAASCSELLSSFVDFRLQTLDNKLFEPRYSDPELRVQTNPGEISKQALDKVQHILENEFNRSELIQRWFGGFVTDFKTPPLEPLSAALSAEKFIQAFQEEGVLYRSEHSRFAYINWRKNDFYLYIDGAETKIDPALTDIAATICNRRQFLFSELSEELKNPSIADFLTTLCNQGKLHFGYVD